MPKHKRKKAPTIKRAEACRLAQAQKTLDLFAEANGRPVDTIEELATWLRSDEGHKATAYDRDQEGKIIPW